MANAHGSFCSVLAYPMILWYDVFKEQPLGGIAMNYTDAQKAFIQGIFERIFGGRHVDKDLLARYMDTLQHLQENTLTKEDLNRISNVLELDADTFSDSTDSNKEEQRLLFESMMMTRFLLRKTE